MPDSSPEEVVEQTASDATAPAQVAEQVSDASPAASSTAEPKADMLSAVKSALQPKEASPASQEPGTTAEAAPDSKDQGKSEAGEDDKLTPEEIKALSQKTQDRIKRLASNVKTRSAEVESLKPKAEEFDKIDRYVRQAGLTNQEVGNLLQIGALTKSNPVEALKMLAPLVNALQQQAGDVLPAELQERVRLGYLTEADARELNRSKAGERIAREQAEKTSAAAKQEAEQREQKTLIDSSLGAVGTWEANQAKTDPDWHLKRTEVSEKVELAILKKSHELGKGWFPTADEAVKLSADALKEVNTRFKRFTLKPSAVTPVTGGASPKSLPAPKTMLDAVRNAVARA